MGLTIYGIAASRAVRPLWAATELGLDFEHVHTPYQGGATRTPEFLALNPNGHIPVVVDARRASEGGGEVVVWESMACALYVARHHGQADGRSISPATPREDAVSAPATTGSGTWPETRGSPHPARERAHV